MFQARRSKRPRQGKLLAGTYRVVLRPIANEIGRHRAIERHISLLPSSGEQSLAISLAVSSQLSCHGRHELDCLAGRVASVQRQQRAKTSVSSTLLSGHLFSEGVRFPKFLSQQAMLTIGIVKDEKATFLNHDHGWNFKSIVPPCTNENHSSL